MKAVVTGATGHLGYNLVLSLLERGWQVVAVMRHTSHLIDSLDASVCTGDIRDVAFLKEAFQRADVVFHLAGVLPLQERDKQVVWDVNVNGTQAVVDACCACNVKRLVHCSSIHAYQDMGHNINSEQSPMVDSKARNIPVYDRSKAQAERIVRDAALKGLDCVCVAPTGVFGPNDGRGSSVGRVVQKLMKGKIPALIAGGIDWVDVRDVAVGIIAAYQKGQMGESYILGGHHKTVAEFSVAVCDAAGVAAPKLVFPMMPAKWFAPVGDLFGLLLNTHLSFSSESLRALSIHQNICIDKAMGELGYAPRNFTTSIRDLVDWHRTLEDEQFVLVKR